MGNKIAKVTESQIEYLMDLINDNLGIVPLSGVILNILFLTISENPIEIEDDRVFNRAINRSRLSYKDISFERPIIISDDVITIKTFRQDSKQFFLPYTTNSRPYDKLPDFCCFKKIDIDSDYLCFTFNKQIYDAHKQNYGKIPISWGEKEEEFYKSVVNFFVYIFKYHFSLPQSHNNLAKTLRVLISNGETHNNYEKMVRKAVQNKSNNFEKLPKMSDLELEDDEISSLKTASMYNAFVDAYNSLVPEQRDKICTLLKF